MSQLKKKSSVDDGMSDASQKANVLCADIGTTSLKAAVIDASGNVLSYSQQFFPLSDSSAAAKYWFPAFLSAWKEMSASCVGASVSSGASEGKLYVSAICISGNGPTVVAKDGRTLLWNVPIDSHLTDGTPAAKSLFLPRIVSFLSNYPDVASDVSYIYSGPEFLIYELTGESATILPEERYRTAYWQDDHVKLITDCVFTNEKNGKRFLLEKLLPPYVAPGTCIGFTLPEIMRQFGFEKPVPVFGGGPDFIAAMVGTNSLASGKWYDCAGSSEGLNLCSPIAQSFDGLRLLPSVNSALWNIAALETESGRIFHNYRQMMEGLTGKKISYEELIDRCLSHKDSEGFEVLSFVAENFRRMTERIKEVASELKLPLAPYITVTGGQAKNEKWMQFKCDVAKVPLAVCNYADAELIGDAVIAQKGLGNFNSIEEAADALVKVTRLFEPS